jgi:hypothetical protein
MSRSQAVVPRWHELEPAVGPRTRRGRRSTLFYGHCVEDCSNIMYGRFYDIGGHNEWILRLYINSFDMTVIVK